MKRLLSCLRGIGFFTKNLLFPSCCRHCKQLLESGALLCKECSAMIHPIATSTLSLTRTKSMKVIAVSGYKDPIRSLILAKHRHDIIACNELAQLIWEFTIVSKLSIDHFVTVPLHWTRMVSRGYNQADEIAKVLARKKNITVAPLLKRVKKTKFQAGLSGKQRAENLVNAFEINVINKEYYYGKNLALVDDVMTTGSTLKSAGLKLLELKPASITVIVATRVI